LTNITIPTQMDILKTKQLYFQQVRPMNKCDAEDGRVVGHMLVDLVGAAPKDLPHDIRQFANRTEMLRACGFRHMGDMLVAILAPSTHTPSAVARLMAHDGPTSVKPEQANAMGDMLMRVRSSQAPASALHEVVDSDSILCALKTQHAWFIPMLEVLLVPPEGAESRRHSLTKRNSAIVTPQAMAHDASNEKFDSVVCAPFKQHPTTARCIPL
jgi:hypothetical protein